MNRSFPPFRKTPTLPDDANWLLGVAAVVIGHTRSLFPNNNRRDAIKCYTIFI